MSWYLNSTLDLYQQAQEAVNSRLSQAKNATSTPFDYMRNLLAGHPWRTAAHHSEVEQLRRRVNELQTRLAQHKKPARRSAKRERLRLP